MDEVTEKVGEVNNRLEHVEEDVKSFKAQVAKEIQELKNNAAAASSSTPPPRSTTMTESAGATASWRARVIHIRGWSPYGSKPDTKLTKSDARDLQQRVQALLDEEDQRKLRWPDTPDIRLISAEVLNAQQEDPKSVCDRIQLQLMRQDIKLQGNSTRAGLEVSPAKKMRLREWFDAKDLIKQLNLETPQSFPERGMETWDGTEMLRIGLLHMARDTFRWCEIGAATLGIKIPTDVGDTPRDMKHEEQPADQGEKMENADGGNNEMPKEQQPPQPPPTVRDLEGKENSAEAMNVKKPRLLKPAGTL